MPSPRPLPLSSPRPRRVWTVAEIVAAARNTLEDTYAAVCVRGEISNYRPQASGHWYFNLKDERAVLPVAMFQGDNLGVPFEIEDGLEVVAIGRLTVYESYGRFQLIANLLEPVGWGAQQLAFEQLRRRLQHEGLFDPERKRPLPILPSCIGIVTSADGAAWRDMTRVWERRQVNARLILSPTRVQGDAATGSIVRAIRRLDRHPGPEVIIVARGGGSRDDLWSFNEEAVARAIAACRRPVITGIGHEIDTTIADLAADLRAATPTAAAEVVAPARSELLARLAGLQRRCAAVVGDRIERAERRLQDRRLHRALSQPARAVQAYAQRLDDGWQRLEAGVASTHDNAARRLRASAAALWRSSPATRVARARTRLLHNRGALRSAIQRQVHERRESLASVAGRTQAMSPLAVLARGYAVCLDEGRSVVRSSEQVAIGSDVTVRLGRGEIGCTVRSREPQSEDP